MPADRTPALVLRAFDFAETSQVLHLFTRDLGRVHGIAKGARRLQGAFHGGADVLLLGEAHVYARRGAAELRTLGAFVTETHFPGLRLRLPRFHAAAHVAALLLGFAREEQPLPELFDLAVSCLRLLEEADDDAAAAYVLGFEAMLLRASGFAPELGRCVACDRPARNVQTAPLSALRGGLLCRACRSEDRRAATLTGPGVAALRLLLEGPLAAAPEVVAPTALRRELRQALDAWTTTVLDRPLRTSRWL